MQFSTVLSLVFAGIVAAQDVTVTFYSATNFEGVSHNVTGTADDVGACTDPFFPLIQSAEITEGWGCALYTDSACKQPYYSFDNSITEIPFKSAVSGFQCGKIFSNQY